MRSFGNAAALALVLVVSSIAASSAQSNVEALYREATKRETALRREFDAPGTRTAAAQLIERARTLAQTFEDLARLFPRSGYSDNALWQGAMLAADTFWEFGDGADRERALRLFEALKTRYPTSSLVKQIAAQTARLASAASPASSPARPASPPPAAPKPVAPAAAANARESTTRPVPAAATVKARESAARPPAPAAATPSVRRESAPVRRDPAPVRRDPAPAVVPASAPAAAQVSTLSAIRREVLQDALRITIELEREAQYYDERIEGPARIFIDLYNTRAIESLKDATINYGDDVVRQVRIGRHEDGRTRVVLDLDGAARHSVYVLYNPYRIVVDVERLVPRTPPAAPRKNNSGSFSLSRQLGLGVARVVIDPGHGGHDPGAQVRGLTEAELTLDIALRLEKRLLQQPGVEVVLTRRTNAYVPLEERTAIANRSEADLFLSIHANASGDARASGFETYFLNFASNSAAEAVAARENAGSSRTMRELPDIVKAIALNNKVDESRDFATMIQAALSERLRRVNKQARNLGVKQAPFVVLIGATMPSVLAEISFLTNTQEAALLRTSRYREQIAEALMQGVMRYQRSLKAAPDVARR